MGGGVIAATCPPSQRRGNALRSRRDHAHPDIDSPDMPAVLTWHLKMGYFHPGTMTVPTSPTEKNFPLIGGANLTLTFHLFRFN